MCAITFFGALGARPLGVVTASVVARVVARVVGVVVGGCVVEGKVVELGVVTSSSANRRKTVNTFP